MTNDRAAAPCAVQRPGRPREQRADRAIIEATLHLFADEGYHSMSVEAVAAKAEVSKATIYRRWAGKRELVIDALATLNDDFPAHPDPNCDTRELLLMALRHMSSRDSDSLAGRIMPRMMVYSVSQPDLYAEYFDRVIMPRRQWLYAVLRQGIGRGELRPDLDIEMAAIALIGPVMLQINSSGRREQRADLPERLMEMLWPGLTPATAPAAPALMVRAGDGAASTIADT
ncbi:MAG: TetR/AcrR family transcriptional regulator [Nakamurella sp.]